MKFVWAFLIAAVLALSSPALAQNPATVKLCVPTSPTACAAVSATNPLPITGSFSATLAGFTPNGNYSTLTATAASSASTALPAGTVVAFQNLSAIDVSCVLTAGASTATTNKLIVRAGATVYYTVGSNTTTACINQTGVASNIVGLAGGAGLGTAFGGASAGGGGGGAVTLASGAVASGAYSAGSVAAGAYVSGSILSGALASGAVVDITNLSTPIAAGAATATKGILLGGQHDSTQKTLTNGQQGAVSLSARGAIMVNPGAEAFPVTSANFTPNGNYTTLTATAASSASTALPAGTVVAFQNTTNVDVSCVLSAGAATATTNKLVVHGGSTVYYDVGANVNAACINQTGSASNVIGMAGGAGLGTSFGTIDTTGLVATVSGPAATGTALSGGPVRVGMSDGTNAQNWLAAIALGDGVNGNNTGAVANWLWNGTTYDRARGDATNGAWVNVKNTLTAVTPGDGITTTVYGTAPASPVIGVPLLWNGTTYDRQKSAGATGVAAVRQTDGTNVASLDPCQSETKSTLPITLATAAVKVIAVGVSAKKIYVCQIHLTNNAADSVAIFEATTATTCATSAVAVVGAGTSVASAATGYNFAANGGISLGSGASQVLQTATNANDLCIAQSAATQLTGSITYVTR